jgi:transglutaminase-like putative cysteine protease
VSATLQVAPSDATVQVCAERWLTDAEHHGYIDADANRCERLAIPAGASRLVYEADVEITEPGDVIARDAVETPIDQLPDELIRWLMPSRFCLPDELGHEAWERFGSVTPGWDRVQAIVDFVHHHLQWTAGASNPWTTAADAHRAGQGVCRDFAHLAITFCRALNIPARYVVGYIPEIDVPPATEPIDFAAWFEVNLDGVWHTFDARNNRKRVGRVVVGRGRDAVDVAILTSFGPVTLNEFAVRAA